MSMERMEHRWNDDWQRKIKVLREKPAPVTSNPLQISPGIEPRLPC